MVSNQVAPIAASTRGNNAWRTFQATPDIARAILGTARRRTREGVSGIRSPAARSGSIPSSWDPQALSSSNLPDYIDPERERVSRQMAESSETFVGDVLPLETNTIAVKKARPHAGEQIQFVAGISSKLRTECRQQAAHQSKGLQNDRTEKTEDKLKWRRHYLMMS